MKKLLTILTIALGLGFAPAEENKEDGFVTIFDGTSLDGWKLAEKEPNSFTLKDGVIIAHGPRSHLFYVGEEKPFKNFVFRAKVKTEKNSNGGIFFHTKYQEKDWPSHGHEAQVNNTFERDPRKSGSIYRCKDVMNTSPVGDGEWWDYEIKVVGQKITISFNGKVVNEYDEPEGGTEGVEPTRKLSSGTFALQAHDPDSIVHYKDIQVKRLPE